MPTRRQPPVRGLLRRAVHTDLPRLFEIWTAVDEHRLRDGWDGFLATADRFLTRSRLWVWADAHDIQGFGAADPLSGEIEALFVHPAAQGRGIGRALLRKCCDSLLRHGHRHAWLLTSPGTRAERFYRDAGWTEIGVEPSGARRLRKWLVG
jgi:GNAT superfamily N-acetyltransferase